MRIKKLIPLMSVMLFSGCSLLPGQGPTASNIIDGTKDHKVNVVNVNEGIAQKLYVSQVKQKLSELKSEVNFNGAVNIGDVLSVAILEAPPAVLFGSSFAINGEGSSHFIKLPEQMVNKKGNITIPFIGNLYVKGKTPEKIQAEIISRLKNKANEPQVIVQVVQNNSATVSVIRQGSSIRMPLC